MSFLKSISFAGLLVAATTAAQAELIICNNTAYTQGVSIGYNSGDQWVSEGWWNVSPGACSTVVGGDLRQRYYYYRAEIDGGPFRGEDYYFCTTPSEYTIYGDGNCAARGYDREAFSQIDTGQSNTKYTLTLVP